MLKIKRYLYVASYALLFAAFILMLIPGRVVLEFFDQDGQIVNTLRVSYFSLYALTYGVFPFYAAVICTVWLMVSALTLCFNKKPAARKAAAVIGLLCAVICVFCTFFTNYIYGLNALSAIITVAVISAAVLQFVSAFLFEINGQEAMIPKVKQILLVISCAFILAALILMAVPGGIIINLSGSYVTILEKSYFSALPYIYGIIPFLAAMFCMAWLALSAITVNLYKNPAAREIPVIIGFIVSGLCLFCAVLTLFFPGSVNAFTITVLIVLILAAIFQVVSVFLGKLKKKSAA